jgi:hypothetical protein
MSSKTKEIKRLIELATPSSLEVHILPFIQSFMDSHYNNAKHKEIIDTYLSYRDMINTLNKRLDLHYTLSVSSDRGYGEFVVAKVKWEQEGVKKKYPYYNVQIGYLKNFKKGLKDPQLILEADIKVKEFINKKFPIEIMNIDGEILKIKS